MSDAIISISPATLYNLRSAKLNARAARQWKEAALEAEAANEHNYKLLQKANDTIREQNKLIASLQEEVKQLKARVTKAEETAIKQSALAAAGFAQRDAISKNSSISWDEVKKIGKEVYEAELKKHKRP